MTSRPPDVEQVLASMRRGMVIFAGGIVVIALTLWLRAAGTSLLAAYGPFVPMFAGAYAVVAGTEKIFSGYRGRGGLPDAAQRARVVRAAAAGLPLVALGAGCTLAIHIARRPYWTAVRDLAAGDEATARLRAVAERQVAALQADGGGLAALAAWRTAAESALPLRPRFASSLDAARYLSTRSSGALKMRAENDVLYYTLCLEWMDLYDRVRRSIDMESMSAPPVLWEETQDDIVDRIQALPHAP